MKEYEQLVSVEMRAWEQKIMKRTSLAGRYAKTVQNKLNAMIPEKVNRMITASIKKMVTTVLIGSEYTTKQYPLENKSFEDRELLVKEKIKTYQRTAVVEGAGTGAGGLLLGAVDFPLLLGIKMKFLFDVASVYGYDVKDYRERLYILYLFQLAFSSDAKRREVYEKVKNWDETVKDYPSKEAYLNTIDWQTWQQEYRDTIDLAKLLQLMPGIGAVVGAVVNYRFLDALGETAMNGYRLRIFK